MFIHVKGNLLHLCRGIYCNKLRIREAKMTTYHQIWKGDLSGHIFTQFPCLQFVRINLSSQEGPCNSYLISKNWITVPKIR